MRKTLILAIILLSPLISIAQSGCVAGQVSEPDVPTGTGQPSPNVLVRVCTATATGTPCSPTATNIYSDPALTNPLTPSGFPSDQYGNWSFCSSPSNYLVQITTNSGIVYSSYHQAANASASVSSVGLIMPGIFSVANSPITGSGNLTVTLATESAYQVLGNCTGSTATPSFCALVASMIPATLNATTINGLTVSGNGTVSGTLGVTGASTLSGGGSLAGTFTGSPTLSGNPILSGSPSVTGTLSVANLKLPSSSQTITALSGTVGTSLGTTSGAFANNDLLCANSTGDIVDCGIAKPVTAFVSLAGDLGNVAATPWVLSTHLSVPLPVAQGGTGINNLAFSGNTVKVATVSGSLTSGDGVKVDASGNLIDSGTSGTYVVSLVSGYVLEGGQTGACGGGGCSVSFPHTFSSTPVSCVATGVGGSVNVSSFNTTSLSLNSSGVSNAYYQCLGAY